jgi:hypothetical protein
VIITSVNQKNFHTSYHNKNTLVRVFLFVSSTQKVLKYLLRGGEAGLWEWIVLAFLLWNYLKISSPFSWSESGGRWTFTSIAESGSTSGSLGPHAVVPIIETQKTAARKNAARIVRVFFRMIFSFHAKKMNNQ